MNALAIQPIQMPFGRFACGVLTIHCHVDVVPGPHRIGKFWGSDLQPIFAYCNSPFGSNSQRFYVLPNYMYMLHSFKNQNRDAYDAILCLIY